jgi:hypothetical protein
MTIEKPSEQTMERIIQIRLEDTIMDVVEKKGLKRLEQRVSALENVLIELSIPQNWVHDSSFKRVLKRILKKEKVI